MQLLNSPGSSDSAKGGAVSHRAVNISPHAGGAGASRAPISAVGSKNHNGIPREAAATCGQVAVTEDPRRYRVARRLGRLRSIRSASHPCTSPSIHPTGVRVGAPIRPRLSREAFIPSLGSSVGSCVFRIVHFVPNVCTREFCSVSPQNSTVVMLNRC